MRNLLVGLFFLVCSSAIAADNNLVIVLDTSSSMNERMAIGRSRMDVVKDVLVNVLKDVPDNTHVGIVTFQGWIYEFGPVNKTNIEQSIRNVEPFGATPLWQYIKVGTDRLLEAREKNSNSGVYKLVVATDGEAGDAYLAERGDSGIGYLADIKNRGIVIDAIGVDMAQDHSLATQVNGSYMNGDDPRSLRQAVQRAVAEVKFEDIKFDVDFQAIADLPEEFAAGAVAAVSTYQNHPVGDEAPANPENGGSTSSNDATVTDDGLGAGFIALIVVGLIAILAIITIVGAALKH